MRDEWSGLADLLANLIAKYAGVIDTDSVEIPKKQENSCGCANESGKPQNRKIAQESIAEGTATNENIIEESIEESVEERSSA